MEEAYVSAIPYIKEIEEKQSKIIGIEGMCGAGKSTLGEVLHTVYPESNLFHADDYFLQPHQRTAERFAEVGGNLDRERMKEEIKTYQVLLEAEEQIERVEGKLASEVITRLKRKYGE